MTGISQLKEQGGEFHETTTDNGAFLKSEFIGDVSQNAHRQEPGSALLRSEYLGNTKYNEQPVEEEELADNLPKLKERFVALVGDNLKDVMMIEGKRKNLAMRFDFCLTEIFAQIDVEKRGYIGINDLDEWTLGSKIGMN